MSENYIRYSHTVLEHIFDYFLASLCLIIALVAVYFLSTYGSLIHALSILFGIILTYTAIMLSFSKRIRFNLNTYIGITDQIIAVILFPISIYAFIVEIFTTSSFLDGIGFFFGTILLSLAIILWLSGRRIYRKPR